MKWSWPIGQIKGIPIRIHATFALVLIWAAFEWGVQRGLGFAGALYGVLFFSLLFLCVTLHELGHSLVALRYGAKVRHITLYPIGGVARLESEIPRPSQEFWMSIAGPAVNVALFILLGVATLPLLGWRALGGLDLLLGRIQALGLERLLLDLLLANAGLAIFNLLPAFPMDGGRVLRSLLAIRMGSHRATRAAMRIGQGLAALLGLLGLFTGALNLVLIALFIFFGARQEWRGTQLRMAMQELPASTALLRGGMALSPHDMLARAIDITLRNEQANFAVFDESYLVGVLTHDDITEGFQRYGPHVSVGRVMCTNFPVAQISDTLLDLQREMQKSGASVISILEGQRYLGLATLESVRNALGLIPARSWQSA
ncbi:MAG TPA: site-2 protease family protein [Chloroflexi bacterium]|nr:site-2 protease family protein [Chloroflexota bacterium]